MDISGALFRVRYINECLLFPCSFTSILTCVNCNFVVGFLCCLWEHVVYIEYLSKLHSLLGQFVAVCWGRLWQFVRSYCGSLLGQV